MTFLKRLRAAIREDRRPKVAANLAPPSYCSTSATVNRLATRSHNPNSVPQGFRPVFGDFPRFRLHDTYEFDRLDHNPRGRTTPLTRSTFGVLQG